MFLAGVVCHGGFPVGEAGAFGICGSGFGFLVVFGVYALPPYGHVVHLWGCVRSPESRRYPLNDLSIVLQSPSNVKHY